MGAFEDRELNEESETEVVIIKSKIISFAYRLIV